MKKPISPAEWDAATDFQRRKGIVPKVRPTEEQYVADLAKWEATQAASAAKTERPLDVLYHRVGRGLLLFLRGDTWRLHLRTRQHVHSCAHNRAGKQANGCCLVNAFGQRLAHRRVLPHLLLD